MRNNFFYILIFCAFTKILTKDVEKKPAGNEPIKQHKEFYVEEAKKDIQNLLTSVKSRKFSVEDEDDAELQNESGSTKIMTRIDSVVERPKSKKTKKKQKTLRYNDHNIMINDADNFNDGDINNLPFNHHNFVVLAHPNIGPVKSRISGGQDVKPLSQNQVNHVDIQPDVFPILPNKNVYAENRGISSREDSIRLSDQYFVNGEDRQINLMNQVGANQKEGTVIRTSIPITENYDIKELLNRLHINRGEDILTQTTSGNNVGMRDYFNKFYTQSSNQLRPGNGLDSLRNHFNDYNDNLEFKDRDHSNTIFLRNDLFKINSTNNDRLNEYMKYFNIGRQLRTSHSTLSYQYNGPSEPSDYRNRKRRSINTQAGYTQDPDTCKTYNENLVKLWSNLSKLTNITEQPNDRALHNIAMMIQAYLEHQNAKPPTAVVKEKHERPRDKISEIIIKIRKLLTEAEGSADKITNIIIKYLKPDYTDAESEDCKEVNEEYLGISVDLVYKNYLENMDCQGNEDGMARSEKQSLREKYDRTSKTSSGSKKSKLSLVTNDFKPDYQVMHLGDEMYNDFHKGKVPRQRPINKNRRVFKPSEKENESEKLRKRSKSASKKVKKSSLKSNLVKGRCENYATRQLMVSLRSVMERFMGLFECQLDNTLRSLRGRDSNNPYYLFASKFNSEEDSLHHKKTKSRSLVKGSKRIRNSPRKKINIKHLDTSIENYQNLYIHDLEDSETIRQYIYDKIKRMKSATPRDTNGRTPAYRNKQHGDSDLGNYNEYFQSPPLYNDYDGIYKYQKATNLNGVSSSHNKKKTTRDKQSNKELVLSSKEPESENSDEYDTYYEEMFTEEPEKPYNVDQQTESSYIETPFTDLTKLRSADQLIGEKSKTHIKDFESIGEFLKKAQDSSLQTPEFAVPFALDTNKGYVELTHLIKYPKIIMYRPQFLVKNTMPYDDFLKTINNNNMTNDDVRLMKIVRHLPDSSVQVLFETENFEAPLEVRNLNENRRSGSPDPVENNQLESRIDTANENIITNMTDGDSGDFIPMDRNESRRIDLGALVQSDLLTNVAELSPDFNSESDSLRANEELSSTKYSEYNSDPNSTLSSLFTVNSSSDSSEDVGSGIDSQLGPDMELETGTGLNLDSKLNPVHTSHWSSFFSKLIPSHSKPKPNILYHLQSPINPHSFSDSDSIVDNSNQEIGNNFSSSTHSAVSQWWRNLKNIFKDKIKQIVRKMASLADKIDDIV